MKKFLSLILALALASSLAACGRENTSGADSSSTGAALPLTTDGETSASASPETEPILAATDTDISADVFDEDVRSIVCGNDNQLLVVKSDRICLYDAAADTVLAEQEVDADADQTQTWYCLENGFCSFGYSTNSECVFYDENLQKTDSISEKSLSNDSDFDPGFAVWAISPDGAKIAFYEMMEENLLLYDRASGETTKLITGDAENHVAGELAGIDSIYFTDHDALLLLGQVWVEGDEDSANGWATIQTDGTQLTVHSYESFGKSGFRDVEYAGGTILSKEYADRTDYAVDIATGKETAIPLDSEAEQKQAAYLSRDGSYFATLENDAKDSAVIIRIYQTSDGKQVLKQEVAPENTENLDQPIGVDILDDLHIYFVEFGGRTVTNTETKQQEYIPAETCRLSW